jgi:uncharacterized protein YneF (UPF0154 family)
MTEQDQAQEQNPNPPVAENDLRWAVEEIGNRVAQMQILDGKLEQLLRGIQFNSKLLGQIQQTLEQMQARLPPPRQQRPKPKRPAR